MVRRTLSQRWVRVGSQSLLTLPQAMKFQSRLVHTVARLGFDANKGVPGLYSSEGYRVAWLEAQNFFVERLGRSTVDTDNESRFPFHILLNAAGRPDMAHVFNYASQVHNNHLFFGQLRNAASPNETKPTGHLQRRIEQSFGSLQNLRTLINHAASRILGQGWVFVVEKPDKSLAIIACNGAGSPYTFQRAQEVDFSALVSEDDMREHHRLTDAVQNNVKNYNIALLALNLWQHAYVPDFGVDGRERYIDAWWSALDWEKISQRLFTGSL